MCARKLTATEPEPERCVLVGVELGGGEWTCEESLDELERLALTDGAVCHGRVVQRLNRPYAKTFLGSGKVEELRELCEAVDADVIIFDDELTPSQQANLEQATHGKFKIIDRTALILDIFGQHATTHEGKIQVQMAQLQYLYPRLRGMWAHLAKDKTRGGIGSRFGQGESQLEVDRRLIRNRIASLRRELDHLESMRYVQRKERIESSTFRVALAGYTNAGKSTLLNAISGSEVYVQDQLFATLDPTTRIVKLPMGKTVLVTDTVGFIQKLPTTLIEAFKSTLSEVKEADLILEVADASDPHVLKEIDSVDTILGQIDAGATPRIVVYNKSDAIDEPTLLALLNRQEGAIAVSALTGDGLDTLIEHISKAALSGDVFMQILVPYGRGDVEALCHRLGHIHSTEYVDGGTSITLSAPPSLIPQIRQFAV